ncbi:MAG TPA: hypothetical protein VIR02_10880, partial [Anaerolineales bacterium]
RYRWACHPPLADEVQTVLRTLFLNRICTRLIVFDGDQMAKCTSLSQGKAVPGYGQFFASNVGWLCSSTVFINFEHEKYPDGTL